MVVRYVCKHCGYIIWEFREVGQDYYGIPTPSEIMLVTGGICPRCKHELSMPEISNIKIRPRRHYRFTEIERHINESMRGWLLNSHTPSPDFMTAQEA